jgi:hypothetical protein
MTGQEYFDLVDEFIQACFNRWPNVIVQVPHSRDPHLTALLILALTLTLTLALAPLFTSFRALAAHTTLPHLFHCLT